MSKWLSKVSGGVRRDADAVAVEPFELLCPCSATVGGFRHQSTQRVLCTKCGESFFVLPIDVYPAPRRKKRRTPRRRRVGAKMAVRTAATRVRGQWQHVTRRAGHGLATAGTRSLTGIRSILTPFRIILVCLSVVVAATLYWIYWSRTMEQAEITFKRAVEQGQAALKNADFLHAMREYETACRALDLLGRDDSLARTARQMLHESTAGNRLLPEPLFDIMQTADKVQQSQGSTAWKDYVAHHLVDTWVVMQTAVSRTLETNGQDRYTINYPLMAASRPVVFEADLAIFDQLPWNQRSLDGKDSTDNAKTHDAIFAAQVEDCRLSDKTPRTWIIRLESDTAFLWSNYDNFCTLGFQTSDEKIEKSVQSLLAAQSEILGIEP